LILGAGINGAAVARELAACGARVTIADQADLSSGTTAYSSRLIHGGLRYLEFGEISLVRESLAEREALLRLAPTHVQPLELVIPLPNQWGGFGDAARRIFRLPPSRGRPSPRGRRLIQAGLWLYDRFSKADGLPRHRIVQTGTWDGLAFDARRFPWQAAYFDAQITFPERFVVDLLFDASLAAADLGQRFDVLTYHQAARKDRQVVLRPVLEPDRTEVVVEPDAVVNATGAWVDHTLARLQIPSRRLIGGTKGSHLFTRQAELRRFLGNKGIYAEAGDGRPVFILPFFGGVLIGTTDIPFDGDPDSAVATEEEVEYLLEAVHTVIGGCELNRDDVELRYCGVRPLPHTPANTPASVSRRHWIVPHSDAPSPTWSIVGGKLTTCRSLAREAAREILAGLGHPWQSGTLERPIPRVGPPETRTPEWICTPDLVPSLRALVDRAGGSPDYLDGTTIPLSAARWAIDHEWARTLFDLVERRLMLLYHHPLTEKALRQLVHALAEAGRWAPQRVDEEIEACKQRLLDRFGKRVVSDAPLRPLP
jgi:glycerol-3-phosphate dehydrogenase